MFIITFLNRALVHTIIVYFCPYRLLQALDTAKFPANIVSFYYSFSSSFYVKIRNLPIPVILSFKNYMAHELK